jgi:hypothetical protein
MSESATCIAGGCLCGALRYEAQGEPTMSGLCYCGDCRKVSGSGFIGFMGFQASALRVSGETRSFTSKSARGTDAVRNFCAVCGSLVFGGILGQSASHTIYAGSLDDPSRFVPKIAIFARNRATWAVIPPELTVFDALPA